MGKKEYDNDSGDDIDFGIRKEYMGGSVSKDIAGVTKDVLKDKLKNKEDKSARQYNNYSRCYTSYGKRGYNEASSSEDEDGRLC